MRERPEAISNEDISHVREIARQVASIVRRVTGDPSFQVLLFGSWAEGTARPRSDVEIGHNSMIACHLANIAFRVGRVLCFDPTAETIIGDPDANQLLGRTYRKGFEL